MLVDAREILNIPWSNPKRQYSAHKILDIQNVNELDIRLFRQCAPLISDLWQDKAIKDAFDRRREFQIVSDRMIELEWRTFCYSVVAFSE